MHEQAIVLIQGAIQELKDSIKWRESHVSRHQEQIEECVDKINKNKQKIETLRESLKNLQTKHIA